MNKLNSLEALLGQRGLMRVGELLELGYPKTYLRELELRGLAVRHARGLYMPLGADISSDYTLSLVCKKISGGVVCLLSALSYHEIGTQTPHEVWMTIDRKARLPYIDYPSVRFVRASGEAKTEGVMTNESGVRVYNPAKTVADCFKYRNKIGLDVALEALKEGWRNRRFSMDELTYYARICRVENVMTPYVEAIV